MACYSVEVGEAKPNEGAPRRSTLSPNELQEFPEPGITTIYDVLQRSVRNHAQENGIGYRDVIKMHDVDKEVTKTVGGKEVKETKTWKYFELSDYKYWTYAEFGEKVTQASSALQTLGLSKSTTFNIYSSTSPRWFLMAMACASQSIAFCTSYDSLGEEGLKHSLNEPEVVGIFTNADLLKTVLGALPDTHTVKTIVYDGELDEKSKDLPDKIRAVREGIKVVHFDELLKIGQDEPKEAIKPKPEDVACIMYTSGSTGAPKGVVLTHKNVVASIAGVTLLLADYIKLGESYIAYLPLAHILEFVVEMCMFSVGVPMGYGTVKTLTDNSVKNCVGDIRAFKPTIMVGVPAVWELIRKGIVTKVNAGGAIKKGIFNFAMGAKRASPTLLGPITDAVVFKAVKQATGGRLKYAMSGGAMISTETQHFLNTCLTTFVQGYGMTESCGMCAILPPAYVRYHTVGIPVPSIEVKLVDVPDANYFSNHTPSQGEIYIRGNSVTSGYYKRDDLNKETFTSDGWMMTGDIGQWNSDGTLSIIDRKKNLVKLSGGEYVALERLESTYKACPIVSNIMVHADSNAKQPMAVVFPHEANLKSLAGKDTDLQSLCKDPKVQEAALKELNATGKKQGFKTLELLQCVILTPEEWTPQNGLLTAAQKLNRKPIFNQFEEEIDKIYPYFSESILATLVHQAVDHTLGGLYSMKSARPCKVLASAAGARVQPVQRRFASQFALSEAGAFKVATSEEGSGPTSAITVALKAGPRFETAPGAASCLKNFVFRATNKRSALRIIREAEIYGGVLSTSLSREHLFLTAEFLSGDEAYFAEILGDVVSQSRLLPHEFVEEVAPSTLAEYEYAMHSPQALALDKLHTLAFRTGLGNSLYATPEVSMDHSKAASFAQAAFSSPVNVAVLANNVSSSVLKSLVGEHFAAGNASISAGALTSSATKYHGGEARVPLAGDKAFLAIAFKAATSPQYAVLKELLGGEPSVKWSKGISGLASAAPGAKAFYSAYSDAALIGFTISASNARAGDIAVKAVAELKRIAKGGLKQEEAKQAIAKAKFAAASALDSRVGKLELVGAELLSTGKLSSMDDAFAALDKVTGDAVAKAASEALKSKMSYVAVGNPSLPYADSLGV